jgi:hypothetical protein
MVKSAATNYEETAILSAAVLSREKIQNVDMAAYQSNYDKKSLIWKSIHSFWYIIIM